MQLVFLERHHLLPAIGAQFYLQTLKNFWGQLALVVGVVQEENEDLCSPDAFHEQSLTLKIECENAWIGCDSDDVVKLGQGQVVDDLVVVHGEQEERVVRDQHDDPRLLQLDVVLVEVVAEHHFGVGFLFVFF